MKHIKEIIYNSYSFKNFSPPGTPGESLHVQGLSGSLRSFLISYLFEKYDKSIIFITSDTDSAERLRDDLDLLLEKGATNFFPSQERLVYDDKPANPSLTRLRLETLRNLIQRDKNIIIATLEGFLSKVPKPEYIVDHQEFISKGKKYNFNKLLETFVELGYERTEIVEDVGHFAVRGGIVDVYPRTNDDPIRVEFFGDVVESLRTFNVISQRSIEEIEEIELLPNFQEEAELVGLTNYLLPDSIIVLEESGILQEKIEEHFLEATASYEQHLKDNIFPSSPAEKYLQWNEIEKNLKKFSLINFSIVTQKNVEVYKFKSGSPPTFAGHLNRLFNYIKKSAREKVKILIQCDTKPQAERFIEILEEEGLETLTTISIGALHNGFIFPENDVQVLTDHEIFDRFKRRKTYTRFKNGEYLRSLNSLNLHDFVVHVDYGIGQYLGLTTIESGDSKRECIKVTYADGDMLFVSIDRLNRVQKYSSEEGVKAKLTKLGTGEWEKIKIKTKRSVEKIANDLINIYATRKSEDGYAFSRDTHWQKELEASFQFEETEDQIRSINEVKKDLELTKPMDRLLCGDVGYGKTEVALRASFKVVMDGKQVALLVPTTILAYQHFQTFKERMSEFPVNLEMLSRFRSIKDQKEVLKKMEKGEIDVLIGTHRLLSDDIKFKQLGLLIIDEEQRFGVKHKEKLKNMRMTVDVLTMTATPIPRTLHLSLMGARDLSNIETAPRNRMPVITEIHEWDDEIIRGAILREIERGGQVYFVHNRVQTIEGIKRIIQEIVPAIRIAVAHGQLPEKQLENIMLNFIHKKYDVLISTMIIENGLDIPNVNTIIIDGSERFGLAQLYQLRGRVGRANEQAYAYLLVPSSSKLTDLAQKRLRAIQDFTDLGSGFKLALRDMEIRGIGNILGKEQSGNIQSVGFDLYCKILNDEVKTLKLKLEEYETKKSSERYTDPKIDVDFDLIIPNNYIYSESERITVYHRLVNCKSLQELESIKPELRDRFGPLPDQVKNLIDVIEIKVLAGHIYAAHISLKDNNLKINFSQQAKEDKHFYSKILNSLLEHDKSKIRFFGDENKLAVQLLLDGKNRAEHFDNAKKLLQNLN